jgi:uncharacterized membrane protein
VAELSSAKTLGGIGSILLILTLVPSVGFVLGIVGWILVLVSLKEISDITKTSKIFTDALVAVILSIIGLVVAGVVVLGSVFRFFRINGYTIGGVRPSTPPTDIGGLIVGILLGLAVLWVFSVISSVFLKRSLDGVSSALNVGMFRTAALLYLIGAALTIVLVGFIIIFVAEILLIVAFFSIPDDLPARPQGAEPTWAPPMA